MITAIVSFPNFYHVGGSLFENATAPPPLKATVRWLDGTGGNPLLFLPRDPDVLEL